MGFPTPVDLRARYKKAEGFKRDVPGEASARPLDATERSIGENMDQTPITRFLYSASASANLCFAVVSPGTLCEG